MQAQIICVDNIEDDTLLYSMGVVSWCGMGAPSQFGKLVPIYCKQFNKFRVHSLYQGNEGRREPMDRCCITDKL